MENINQILQCLDGFRRLSVEIDTAWRTVLGAQLSAQLDAQGVFRTAVDAVVNGSRAACNSIAAHCNIPYAEAASVQEADLRQYHIQEYFEGQVYDAEGNVLDLQAAYCDCYKMYKTLSRMLYQGAEQLGLFTQNIVAYYQVGTGVWTVETTALVTEVVQPVLESVTALSELLISLGKWHVTEADNYINSFLTE